MITRVARNDVVRVMRTGEVGLIKGWADHEDLDRHGTILDVAMGGGRTVQVNGHALEFVANAKTNLQGGKLGAWWALFILTGAAAVLVALNLQSKHDIGFLWTALIGWFTWQTWLNMFTIAFFKPRKTRIRLPRR